MVNYSTEISVSARYADLTSLLGWIEQAAQAMGIAMEENLRLQLIAEELFINTIDHGHGGDTNSPIWVRLGLDGATACLQYEDAAPACDISQIEPEADYPVRVGGLGLVLIRGLCAEFRYQWRDGRNVVDLTLRRDAQAVPEG